MGNPNRAWAWVIYAGVILFAYLGDRVASLRRRRRRNSTEGK